MENSSRVMYIRQKAISDALRKEYRQYLTGNLLKEQKYLKHIEEELEIGISYYQEFTADIPHNHPKVTEHGLVLKGSIKMKILDGSEQILQFDEGDFFVVPAGVAHATKNDEETKVLFIKSPGGNDKTPVEVDEQTREWLSKWEF